MSIYRVALDVKLIFPYAPAGGVTCGRRLKMGSEIYSHIYTEDRTIAMTPRGEYS